MSIALNPNAGEGKIVYPCSLSCAWQERNVNLVDNQDASPITNPTALETATRLFTRLRDMGTIIRARLRYPSGLTTPVSPIVKLFGRKKALTGETEQVWQPLRNKAGDISVTLTIDQTNDVAIGASLYTTPDLDAHSWDCDGFDEFLFGVETPLSAAAGAVTDNAIQVRII